MNKMKIGAFSLTFLAALVVILLYNKSRMDAKSQADVLKAIPVSAGVVANDAR